MSRPLISDREKCIKEQLQKEISIIVPFDTRLNKVDNRIVNLITELIDLRVSEEISLQHLL